MNYHKIDTCNMNNGDGFRVVLWVSGCSHHCKNCFNPETWNPKNGDKFTKKQLNFLKTCLNEKWCSGITLSGGDPLFNKNLFAILKLCKHLKKHYPNKTIWVYSGFTYEQIIQNPLRKLLIKYCDVLVDGVFIEQLSSPSPKWRGSTNQRVIDVQKSLKQKKVVLHCE